VQAESQQALWGLNGVAAGIGIKTSFEPTQHGLHH
jgi:hypothetical protein